MIEPTKEDALHIKKEVLRNLLECVINSIPEMTNDDMEMTANCIAPLFSDEAK